MKNTNIGLVPPPKTWLGRENKHRWKYDIKRCLMSEYLCSVHFPMILYPYRSLERSKWWL